MNFLLKYILIFFVCTQAFAIEGVYEVIVKRSEEKKQSQWSLGDWLATKQRIGLMDQWLALNIEKNIFEVVLDYSKYSFEEGEGSNKKDRQSHLYNGKFYITLLGFEWEETHNSSSPDYTKYNLSLRFFGTSQQSTHINFLYGKKSVSSNVMDTFKANFFGFDGDIYLLSFLGTSGSFEKLSQTKLDGTTLTGETSSYGAFIELWFLRIYAEKRKEKYYYSGSKSLRTESEGTTFGVSLYL